MPKFITKEMLKDRKRKIVQAEKEALLNELAIAKTQPEEKIVVDENLEQKKKMANAIKNIIKSDKMEKEKQAEKKVWFKIIYRKENKKCIRRRL